MMTMTYASHMLREMVKGVGGDEDTEGDELLWFVKTRLTSRSCGNATNLFTISLHLNITILMIEFDQNPRFNNFTNRTTVNPKSDARKTSRRPWQKTSIGYFDREISHANSVEDLIVGCRNRASVNLLPVVRREGLTERGHMSRCPQII
jgi:hypothetical protein